MRYLKCSKCGEIKKEIEFDYMFWRKKYNSVCKECQRKEKKNK